MDRDRGGCDRVGRVRYHDPLANDSGTSPEEGAGIDLDHVREPTCGWEPGPELEDPVHPFPLAGKRRGVGGQVSLGREHRQGPERELSSTLERPGRKPADPNHPEIGVAPIHLGPNIEPPNVRPAAPGREGKESEPESRRAYSHLFDIATK